MYLHGELSYTSLIIGDQSDNDFVFCVLSSLSLTLHIDVKELVYNTCSDHTDPNKGRNLFYTFSY